MLHCDELSLPFMSQHLKQVCYDWRARGIWQQMQNITAMLNGECTLVSLKGIPLHLMGALKQEKMGRSIKAFENI